MPYASCLQVERLSDDSNGQDTQIFCHFATTGAAPVPVPPPIPAAIKTCLHLPAPHAVHRDPHQPHCANFWISASAQSFGDTATDLNVCPTAVLRSACASVFTAKNSHLQCAHAPCVQQHYRRRRRPDDFNHRVIGKFHWFKHSFSRFVPVA